MVALANFNAPNGVVGDTYNGYQIEAVIDAANGKYRWKLSPPTSLDAVVVNDITGSAPTTVAFAGVEKQLVSYRNTGSSIGVLTPGAGYTFSDALLRVVLLPGESISLTLKGTVVSVVSKQSVSAASVGRIAFQVATTTASETFTLPITTDPADAYTVDWGDGTLTTQADSLVHTYAVAGTYAINIVGTSLKRFAFNGAGDRTKVVSIDVVDLDGFGMTDASGMWRFCNAAKTTFTKLSLSNVTNTSNMFRSCTVGDFAITSIVLNAATNVSFMFYNCALGRFPLAELVLPVATDANNAFYYCPFGDFPLYTFKAPELLDASTMFGYCRSGRFLMSNWASTTDPPIKVTNLSNTFAQCAAASGKIMWWILYSPNVTNMSSFAINCANLKVYLNDTNFAEVLDASLAFLGVAEVNIRNVRFPKATNLSYLCGGLKVFVGEIQAPLVTTINSILGPSGSGITNQASEFSKELGMRARSLTSKIGTNLGTSVTSFYDADFDRRFSRTWLYFMLSATALPFTDYHDIVLDLTDDEIDLFLIWLDAHGPAVGGLSYRQFDNNAWLFDANIPSKVALDSKRSAAAITAKNNLVTKGWTVLGSYT